MQIPLLRKYFPPALAIAMTWIPVTTHAATILANDAVFETERTLDDPLHLWVSPDDFTRINGFVLKPEGACLDDLCIPLRQNEDNELFVKRLGQPWVNATAFANKVQQAYAVDHEKKVWSFGQVPVSREAFLESAMAPDFELKDIHGETVRLSDYRGKKVLLLTWASW